MSRRPCRALANAATPGNRPSENGRPHLPHARGRALRIAGIAAASVLDVAPSPMASASAAPLSLGRPAADEPHQATVPCIGQTRLGVEDKVTASDQPLLHPAELGAQLNPYVLDVLVDRLETVIRSEIKSNPVGDELGWGIDGLCPEYLRTAQA